MLNKNTLGVKKYEANQKQHTSRQVRPKDMRPRSHIIKKRWPSDKDNREKYAINCCMSFKELKVFLIK